MSDNVMTSDTIKDLVRARYGGIAANADTSCCAPAATSCCETAATPDLNAKARDIGYSDDELAAVPEGANLGLGCGNPLAIAAMKPARLSSISAAVPASIACWRRARLARRDA